MSFLAYTIFCIDIYLEVCLDKDSNKKGGKYGCLHSLSFFFLGWQYGTILPYCWPFFIKKMNREELNQFYEVLMMIDVSLDLIHKRAKSIQADSRDKYIYHTVLKKQCAKNAKEILAMVKSIEKRKLPFFALIEEQRKACKNKCK